MSQAARNLSSRWHAPTHALPVDLFRVLVGLVSFAYFGHLFAQSLDFSSPDGLIDHALTQRIFWYTQLGLFNSSMSAGAFEAVFLIASVASLALAAGYRPRLMASFAFVVAVSAYRWNFLVIYVDDGIMHLMLFWIIMLPVGRTLVLREWQHEGSGAIERWKREMVPGGAVRALLVSLALVYVVAGAWKWTSPMWRDGTALYAALRTPIAWHPEFWGPQHITPLVFANYFTLVLEPLFPLMFVLPVNHRIKWALLPALIGFHVGIIATMRVPYANVACLAASVIVFRHEIMRLLTRASESAPARPVAPQPGLCCRMSLAFVALLALAMAGDAAVPAWRGPTRPDHSADSVGKESVRDHTPRREARVGFLGTQHNPLYSVLWLAGIAQSYRLFDWIDDRNFHIHYEITERRPDGSVRFIPPAALFPQSIRAVLLQTYMHGVTWARIPDEHSDDLKIALYKRFARRFCRTERMTGVIEVGASVARVSRRSNDVLPAAQIQASFSCNAGGAQMRYVRSGGDERFATANSARARTIEVSD